MTARKLGNPSGDPGANSAFFEPEQTVRSDMDDQQYSRFLTSLLDARRYVDEFFYNKYGFPAYPYLDILLMGSNTDDKIAIETISDRLSLTSSTTKRHLDLMQSCDLLAPSDTGYLLTDSAKQLLVDFIESKLSVSFTVAD
ncbi:MAG: hypothetical protein ABJO01_12350 [Parasphingorhabdus sp.]|uniref:hypothetical protein n=1 Tax=Parasphingorhabdus sp. TaxID=2709688 RepID=UPI0032988376